MKLENIFLDFLYERGQSNMELVSARIEGYRNIENVEIEFGDITALVSTNSYGKSNLIQALEFAISFISLDKTYKSIIMSSETAIPLNKYIDTKNFVADFVFSKFRDGKKYLINYGYEFIWAKDNNEGQKIIKEWLYLKEDEKSKRYNTLINRNENNFFRSSQTGRCTNKLKLDDNELMINKLLFVDTLYYLDVIESIYNFGIYIEKHLDTTSSFKANSLIRKNLNEFDLNEINNIPRVVYFLKQKHPNKYKLLKNVFFQLFPNISHIEIIESNSRNILNKILKFEPEENAPFTISDKEYFIYAKDVNLNQLLNFEMLSDGTKRVFLMLTYAILADISGISIIALEEPENSIHPSLLQFFLDALSQLTENCKIIITSHSPYILSYLNPENIYIGKPNDESIASFNKFDRKKTNVLLKDACENSDSVGSYIFELLSGDDDDIETLLNYLEK